MKSDINPFESQETKPYQNDPRISGMTDLVDAYQRDEISRYETILQRNTDLLEDPFIAENIDEITRNMRTKAVARLVAPYTCFALDSIAEQLSISVKEVQEIVGFLILEQKLRGKINAEKGIVDVETAAVETRDDATLSWTREITSLWTTVLNDGEGLRSNDGSYIINESSSTGFPTRKAAGFGGGLKRTRGRPKYGWNRGKGPAKKGAGPAMVK